MNELEVTEISLNSFDYSVLDDETNEFLKQSETRMKEHIRDYAPKMGRVLQSVQNELSNRGYGCFEDWYKSLGLKKQSVYNYINAYSFVQALDEQNKSNMALELPSELMYEAGKKNADPELKQQVLDGEINTLKQWHKEKQRMEMELKVANGRALKAEERINFNADVIGELRSQVDKAKIDLAELPEKIVIKEDKFKLEQQQKEIDRLKKDAELLRKKAQLNDKEAKEYAELKNQIEFLTLEKSNLHREIKSTTELSGLAVKIDQFLKTELAPIKYSRVLEQMQNEIAIRNLTDILESVDAWSRDMKQYLPNKKRIEVEVIR